LLALPELHVYCEAPHNNSSVIDGFNKWEDVTLCIIPNFPFTSYHYSSKDMAKCISYFHILHRNNNLAGNWTILHKEQHHGKINL